MARALYRRDSVVMRLISMAVAFAFVLSVTGGSVAIPVAMGAESAGTTSTAEPALSEAPDQPVETADPAASESAAEAPPAEQPSPAPGDPAAVQPDGTAVLAALAASESALAAPAELIEPLLATEYVSFQDVSWDGWRKSPLSQIGWGKENLGEYREDDTIAIRIVIDNKGAETVPLLLPDFSLAFDHFNSQNNAIAIDVASDYMWWTGSTLSALETPPGDADPLLNITGADGGSEPQFIVSYTGGGTLEVPADSYGVVYFKVHLALTPYWLQKTTPRNGAGYYPGSSAQGIFLSWGTENIGRKTISVPVGSKVLPQGTINGLKFNDLANRGTYDMGEPGLSGWLFTLNYTGQYSFTMTATTDANGLFTFDHLPDGPYTLTETQQSPWVPSTPSGGTMSFTLGVDENKDVKFGNYLPDLTKNWVLSIDAMPSGGVPFVTYLLNDVSTTTTLTGPPYAASITAPPGSSIESIQYHVLWNATDILLGTLPDETLEESQTNTFTYDSSVAGTKFHDLDGSGTKGALEPGLGGWTIVMKRVVGSIETTYATTSTDPADGSYEFEDVLPGTYKLYEMNQPGWYNTVAPTTSFLVANNIHVADKDFGNLELTSSITVEKTGPALAHVGDMITYNILVTNTSNFTLYDINVFDELLDLDEDIPQLSKGATWTVSVERTVLETDPDPLPNTVDVLGEDALGSPVADSDDHIVDILKPGITLVKTADPTMAVNPSTIEYRYVVTNSGEDTLTSVALYDDKIADILGSDIGELSPGETTTLTASAELTTNTVNYAEVLGYDALDYEVSANDSATVLIYNPSISIVKSADPEVILEGELVTYTYLVTNTGDIALSNIQVNDDPLGYVGAIPVLAPGAFDEVSITAAIDEDTANVGTAMGEYGAPNTDFHGYVDDTSDAFVDVIAPAIELVKSASPSPVINGTEVTYTYVVRNIGDVELYDVAIDDDQLGAIGSMIETLPVGAEETLTANSVLTETTTNIGLATATDALEHAVDDSDTATVYVYNPSIDVQKSVAPSVVLAGEAVEYEYIVTNTGDITLSDVALDDSVLGPVSDIGELDPDESVVVTLSADILADIENTALVEGFYGEAETDFFGSVDDSDTAFVDVIHPSVDIVKDADPEVAVAGTEIDYSFWVHNTGDVTLYDLVVDDDQIGYIGTIEELAPDDSTTLYASATLSETTTNVVTVEGYDEYENPVDDEDEFTVPIYNPSIGVVKSVDPEVILAGESVEYEYIVTNTGDIALSDVVLHDDILGHLSDIGELDPQESVIVTRAAEITEDTENVAIAEGEYGEEESDFFGSVEDTDTAFVDVVAPEIEVDKSASEPAVLVGETVLYTYVVRNIGDVPLNDVVLTDDRLGIVGTVEVLAVGAESTVTASTALSVPTTNTVEAVGVDDFGHEVSDTDQAFVDVTPPFVPPDLVIDKAADKTVAAPGDVVRYTITYRNTSDGSALDMVITDDFDERWVTVIDAGGGTVSGGKIVWNIAGPLQKGDGAQTLSYRVRIDSDLPSSVSRIRNVVTIFEPNEEDTSDNSDSWVVEIEAPFLPFTGGEWTMIAMAALAAAGVGTALRRRARIRTMTS